MALQIGEPGPQLNTVDSADTDLHELAELASVDTLLKIPADLSSMPFTAGQSIQLTIGRATDGVLATEAYVESASDTEIVLRVYAPLKRYQRRNDVRLPLDVPTRRALRLRSNEDSLPLRSRLLDISAGGVLLRTACQLQVGERLIVGFTLPGDSRELRCALVVRYSRSVGESRFVWDSGCQFQVLRPADRERIARYIFAEQRDAARRGKAFDK